MYVGGSSALKSVLLRICVS